MLHHAAARIHLVECQTHTLKCAAFIEELGHQLQTALASSLPLVLIFMQLYLYMATLPVVLASSAVTVEAPLMKRCPVDRDPLPLSTPPTAGSSCAPDL